MRRFVTVTLLGLALAGCSAKSEPATQVTVTETPAVVTVDKTLPAATITATVTPAADSSTSCREAADAASKLILELGEQLKLSSTAVRVGMKADPKEMQELLDKTNAQWAVIEARTADYSGPYADCVSGG